MSASEPVVVTVARSGRFDSRWTRFRRRLLRDVVLQKWFDYVVLAVIAVNCVLLALDRPLDDPNSSLQKFLTTADYVRTRGAGTGDVAQGCRWLCKRRRRV